MERLPLFLIYVAVFLVPLAHYEGEFSWAKSLILSLCVSSGLIVYGIRLGLWGEGELPRATTLLPLAILGAVLLLSPTWAINPAQGWAVILQQLPNFLLYLLVITHLKPGKDLETLLQVALLSALAVSLYGISQYLRLIPLPVDSYGDPSPHSTLGHTNYAAQYLVAVLPSFLFMAFWMPSTRERLGIGAGGVIIFLYFLMTQSRGGWVGLAAAMVLLFPLFLLGQKRHGLSPLLSRGGVALLALGVAFSLILAFSPLGKEVRGKAASISDLSEAPIHFRLLAWKNTFRVFLAHPLLGVGAGNLEMAFPLHYDREMEAFLTRQERQLDRAHNDYLQILSELGLLGMAAFAGLLAALGRLGYQRFHHLETSRQFWIYLGTLGGILATLVHAFFDFSLQNPTSAAYFFLLIALLEVQRPPRQPAGPFFARSSISPWARWAAGCAAGGGILALSLLLPWYAGKGFLAGYYLEKGRFDKTHSRYQEAIHRFSRSIRLQPSLARAYFERGLCYANQGIPQLAAEDYEKGLALQPYNGLGRKNLGALYSDLGRYEEALKAFRWSLRLIPSRATELHNDLAIVHLRAQRYPEALEEAKKALGGKTPYLEAHFTRGNIYLFQGAYRKAIGEYQTMLRASPRHSDAYNNLGYCYLELGEYRQAIGQYYRALQLTPTSDRLWYNLARAYSLQGAKGKASAALRNALLLNPELSKQAGQDESLQGIPNGQARSME